MSTRTALVTGSSRGIGRALASMLAEEGYAVTISSRRPEAIAAAERELRAVGHDVHAVPADVRSEEEIAALVAGHLDRHGRLDVLVNNAGVGVGAPVGETKTKALDLTLDVNLRSIFLTYREAAAALRAAGAEHGQALVINVASIAGIYPQPWTSIYSATKSAVRSLTLAMNRELGPHGVKSTTLSPSYVDTDMTDYMKDEVPADEMIQTRDVAEMARALLRLSRWCVVPEIVYQRPGEVL